VAAELKKHKRSMERFDLYRFNARYASGVAVFDPAKMRIVDYIKIDRNQLNPVTKAAEGVKKTSAEQQAQSEIE